MSNTDQNTAPATPPNGGHGRVPRFAPGSRVGPHTIRACLGEGPLGEVYTALFGSTGHVVCLSVPPPGMPDPGYKAWMRRIAPVASHPCLARQFDCGVAPDGTPWLRSEFVGGAPEWVLQSPLDPAAVPQADPADEADPELASGSEKYLLVPTLEDLLASAGPALSQRDRCVLFYDVLDALATLHSNGLRADSLDPSDIVLDRVPHARRPVAKLRFYAVDPDVSPSGRAKDLKAAADLARRLFGEGRGGRTPSRLDRDVLALADEAEKPDATAEAFFAAYAHVLSRHGATPEPRRDPEDVPQRPVQEAGAEGDSERRRSHHRRRRHHRRPDGDGDERQALGFFGALASGSEAAQQALEFARAISVVAVVVVFAIAVFLWLRWSDERERRSAPVGTTVAFSAVSVIPLSEAEEQWDAGGISDVYALGRDRLAALAATGNPVAVARQALESLPPDAWNDQNAVRAARDAISPVLQRLSEMAPTRLDAATLWAHAKLLGLGCQQDIAGAIRMLEEAVSAGGNDARLLLGDIYASVLPMPASYPNTRVGRDRRAIALYRSAGGEMTARTPLWGPSADRIVWLLRRASSTTTFADDWTSWLKESAAAGHIPSMVLRAIPGPFATTDPAEALGLLRRISNHPAAKDDEKAFAWTFMAVMFAKGQGAPKSEQSALLWLKRAADKGNGKAMELLARSYENGIGTETGRPDRAAAAEWKRRAADAKPEPSFEPKWMPLSLSEPRTGKTYRAR